MRVPTHPPRRKTPAHADLDAGGGFAAGSSQEHRQTGPELPVLRIDPELVPREFDRPFVGGLGLVSPAELAQGVAQSGQGLVLGATRLHRRLLTLPGGTQGACQQQPRIGLQYHPVTRGNDADRLAGKLDRGWMVTLGQRQLRQCDP